MKHSLVIVILSLASLSLVQAQQTVGLFQYDQGTADGYVLFAPMSSRNTFLIDNCGKEVHRWTSVQSPGASVYLLENGKLLRTGRATSTYFNNGGTGGIIEILDWDSNVEWTYTISDSVQRQHHDIEYLPNGNILAIVWEARSLAECIEEGRDTTLLPSSELWPDKIVELQPIGSDSAAIVWEWYAWDHLVQDFDSTKNNYGVVADHPELIDLNFIRGTQVNSDWLHINSVAYNPELDQILLSNHHFSEVWVIDHSTTTQEAASHTGGNSGKGGDLLYRYGNPQAYDRGTVNDKVFAGQHNAQWIAPGLPGEGNIIVFDNGEGGPNAYSTIDEITPPVDVNGNYTLQSGQAYGPANLAWQYAATPLTDFYSSNISGAQRLANGNTIICEGATGRFFEVDSLGNTLWEYVNPINLSGGISQGTQPNGNSVFRCSKYAEDYPGLVGQTLTAGDPLETNPLPSNCSIITQVETSELEEETRIGIYPNPARDVLTVERSTNHGSLRVQIYDMSGQLLTDRTLASGNYRMLLDLGKFPAGLYSIRIGNGYDSQSHLFSVVK